MSDKDNFDNNNPFSGIVPEQVRNTEEKSKNLDLPKNEDIPTDIKTLGDKLKTLRLNHGLSIEQLADTTRIRSEFLVALEENDFSKLPGLVFAKGFIKNLARFYKIKDEELIKLFQSSSSKSEDDSNSGVFVNKILSKSVENSTEFPPDDITHKKGNILNDSSKEEGVFQKLKKFLLLPKYILLSLLVLLLVGIAVYFIKIDPYTGVDPLQSLDSSLDSSDVVESDASSTNETISNDGEVSNGELSSTNETQIPPTSDTTTPSSNDTTSTPGVTASTSASNNSTVTSSTNGAAYTGRSVVKISVKSSTTIRTKTDSSSWEDHSYDPGEYSFDFKNVFHIFIENSSLVRLSINDVDLGDLSNKGIERRLTFYHNKELPVKN